MGEADIRIVSGISTNQNNEHLYWITLERLKHIDLVPKFLKTSLGNIPSYFDSEREIANGAETVDAEIVFAELAKKHFG